MANENGITVNTINGLLGSGADERTPLKDLLPKKPIPWIFDLPKPSWDSYFMAITMLVAMRSCDQQTKQGCVIVDEDSKAIIGIGFNGHPRGTQGLPTLRKGSAKADFRGSDGKLYHRGEAVPKDVYPVEPINAVDLKDARLFIQDDPDKYPFMCHCDTNALISCTYHSQNATCYLPMPPCEACLLLLLNHPFVKIKRIVYYEERQLPNAQKVLDARPDVKVCRFAPNFVRSLPGAENAGGPSMIDPAEFLFMAAKYAGLRRESSAQLSSASAKTYR